MVNQKIEKTHTAGAHDDRSFYVGMVCVSITQILFDIPYAHAHSARLASFHCNDRPRARAPIIITIITTNIHANTKNSSLYVRKVHNTWTLRPPGIHHRHLPYHTIPYVQATSKEDKIKLEPSVATGPKTTTLPHSTTPAFLNFYLLMLGFG